MHLLSAPTERTPSKESARDGHPFVAMTIDGGLEGLGSGFGAHGSVFAVRGAEFGVRVLNSEF